MAKPSLPVLVLLIEGNRRTGDSIEPLLVKKGFEVARASTATVALACLKNKERRPGVAVFDNAVWRAATARLCRDLRKADLPVLVLAAEDQAAPDNLPDGTATLARPFAGRKLANSIKHLLPQLDGDVLVMSNLWFNVQHHHVRTGCVDHHLTPMQGRLLEVFMRHPGETLSRRYLIKQVWNWNIDDLNDTRTLDVHVRWLREIIEQDADKPRILTTVRGVGYRFGPPERAEEK